MPSDAKMTAEDRLRALPGIGPHADLTAPFWRQLPSTVIWLMEAHAAAAVAEVVKERDSARSGATLAYGRLLELLDVLRERTDALDRVVKERDEALAKYAFMVERAADTKLDGYRELASKLEQSEARVAELEAEVERVRGLLQRGLDLNIVEANGGGVDEWENDVTAALAPQTPPAQLHPATTDLVHRFAAALREKLAAAEQKYGYSDNWRADDWLDECRAQLAAHVAKGDPRDVAAYCAFLWHHGASTAALAPQAPPAAKPRPLPSFPDIGCEGDCGFARRGNGWQCVEGTACGRYVHPGDQHHDEIDNYYAAVHAPAPPARKEGG